MFFLASKILGFLSVPSNLLIVAALAGVCLLLTPWQRLARGLLVASLLLFAIVGFSPLSNMLLLTLTERFPAWQEGRGAPYGIIVLGGAIDSEVSAARGAVELDSSAERVLAMLELARTYPQARIVFSGGSGNLLMNSEAEAPWARSILARFGLTGDRFLFEETSRTTYENAANTHDLVKPVAGQRWLLVTSAFHMPRSVGAFRAVGFDVDAFPVDWRTRGWQDAALPFRRLSGGLARADVAIHEWTGLLLYWLTGRSSELLPKPRAQS